MGNNLVKLTIYLLLIANINIWLPNIPRVYAQQQQAPTVTSRLTIPIAANTTLVVEKGSDGTETKHILVQDHLGSTRMIIAEDGTVTDALSYYPYGSFNKQSGIESTPDPGLNNITNRYYTGQRKVTDTDNLYNYNARYYNPDIAIFTQPDSVEGPNRYAYVGGNPVMLNDPSGSCPGCNDLRMASVSERAGSLIGATEPMGSSRTYSRNDPLAGITQEAVLKSMILTAGVFTAGVGGPAIASVGNAAYQTIGTAATLLRTGTSLSTALGAGCASTNCVQSVGIPVAEMTLGEALPPGYALMPLTYNVGYVGEVPSVVRRTTGQTLTQEEVDVLIAQYVKNGVMITNTRGFMSVGINDVSRLQLNISPNANNIGSNFHELVHLEQFLEAIRHGIPISVLRVEENIELSTVLRALNEIQASRLERQFLMANYQGHPDLDIEVMGSHINESVFTDVLTGMSYEVPDFDGRAYIDIAELKRIK